MEGKYPYWFNETEEELVERTLKSVDKKWDVREGSFMYDSIRAYVTLRAMAREELKNVLDLMFIAKATGDFLDFLIEDKSPLKRFQAKAATGYVTVYGNAKTQLPVGTRYMSIIYNENQEFVEFEQLERVEIGTDGKAKVLIRCLKEGRVGNIPAGVIEIASPLVGIAKVCNEVDFDNGLDRESDKDFKSRYYKWRKEEGTSGNKSDYIKWSLEVPGVGGVQVIPLWNGEGTVKVLIVDQNYYPASADVIKNAIAYICPKPAEGEGKAPIGATVTIESGERLVINVSADIKIKQGYTLDSILNPFKNTLAAYFLNFNKLFWQNPEHPTKEIISFLKIGSFIVDTEGVSDVSNLLINNSTTNIEVVEGKVLVLGQVNLNVIQ